MINGTKLCYPPQEACTFISTLVNQILHVTLFHQHSPSFIIFRNVNLDSFSRLITKVGVFWQTNSSLLTATNLHERSSHLMDNFHEKPWKAVRINIAIFRESSQTMVVTMCQFPRYLMEILESSRVNSLGLYKPLRFVNIFICLTLKVYFRAPTIYNGSSTINRF